MATRGSDEAVEGLPRAREFFDRMVRWLQSEEALCLPLAEVERRLGAEHPELVRRLLQDYYDHAEQEAGP